MEFRLSEEHIQVRDLVRQLAQEEFAPHAARWDQNSEYPAGAIARLTELGFFGMLVPEEFGGAGYDTIAYALTLEELARVSATLSIVVSVHNSVGAWPIVRFGSDDLKRRYLPGL